MLELSQTTISKAIPICVAMIKVGYLLMGLADYFQYFFLYYGTTSYKNDYYEVCGPFLGGILVTFLLSKTESRYVLLMVTEFIFAAFMIISIFASSTIKVYGLLCGGGISLILYPVYAREHFFPSPMNLKNKLVKKYSSILMASLWLSLGLGVIFFYLMQKRQLNNYFFNYRPIMLSDDITPYVFGSLSIINMILLTLIKSKETLYFYHKRGQTHEFNNLIQEIYQSQYHQVMKSAYGEGQEENQYQNLIVSVAESNVSGNGQKSPQQIYQDRAIYFLPFVAGISNVFNYVVSNYQNLIILIEDTLFISQTDDYFDKDYYLYLLILIPMIIMGLISIMLPQRRIFAVGSMTVAFIISLYFIFFNGSFQLTSALSMIQTIALFGGVAPSIFSIPLLLGKIQKLVIYFLLFFLGTYANKLFINGSYSQDNYHFTENYNTSILSSISQFLCLCTIILVKDY